MKFSQFNSLRKLTIEVSECMDYMDRFPWFESKESQYFFIPKLNLMLRTDTGTRLFLDIAKEYRSNMSLFTRVSALGYIVLVAAVLRLGLGSLILKVISLKGSDFYPVIIGGNNRFRLIDSSNSNALLVAKSLKSVLFTKNATRVYVKGCFSDLEIIPELLRVNDRVYFEKQISGLAINRISLTDDQENLVSSVMGEFFLKQKSLSRVVCFETYLRYKVGVLTNFSKIAESTKVNTLVQLFISTGRQVGSALGPCELTVCPAHGDLNRGNIFLQGDKLHIIDWEYFMYRHIDYDETVYKYNLRHQKMADYQAFYERSNDFNFNLLIFLLEELWFRVLNFKTDVSDSQEHVDMVISLIHEKLLISAHK